MNQLPILAAQKPQRGFADFANPAKLVEFLDAPVELDQKKLGADQFAQSGVDFVNATIDLYEPELVRSTDQ